MIKSDKWIKEMALNGMIEPFIPELMRKGVMSYGVSSYGYDLRLGRTFKVFGSSDTVIDPKNFDKRIGWNVVVPKDNDEIIIPPHDFVLGHSVEYIKMPSNVTGLVFPKSTYARCGLVCTQTVLEAGWEGQITLEFANQTNYPIKLYAGEGCAQILFLQSDEQCETSYKDRSGKYQNQTGVTLPKV